MSAWLKITAFPQHELRAWRSKATPAERKLPPAALVKLPRYRQREHRA